MTSSVKKRPNKLKRLLAGIVAAVLSAPLLLVAGATPASAFELSRSPELFLLNRGYPITSASCSSVIQYQASLNGPADTPFTYSVSGLGSDTSNKSATYGFNGYAQIKYDTSNLEKGTYKPVLRINNEVASFRGSSTPVSLSVGSAELKLNTSITKEWTDADSTLTMSVRRHTFQSPDSGENYRAWPLKLIVEEMDGTKIGELDYAKGEHTKSITLSKHTVEDRNIRFRAVNSCAEGTVEARVPGFIKRSAVDLSFTQTGGKVYRADSGPYGTVTLSNSRATGIVKVSVPTLQYFEAPQEFPIVNGKVEITRLTKDNIAPWAGSRELIIEYPGDAYHLPVSKSFKLETSRSTAGISLIDNNSFLLVEPFTGAKVEFNLNTPYGVNPGSGSLSGLKITAPDGKLPPSISYDSSKNVYTLTTRGPIYTESEAIRIAEREGDIGYNATLTYEGDSNHEAKGIISQVFYIYPFVRNNTSVQPQTVYRQTAGKEATVQGSVSMGGNTYSEYFDQGKISLKVLDSTGKQVFTTESSVSRQGRYTAQVTVPTAGSHTLVTQYLGKGWTQDSPPVSQEFEVDHFRATFYPFTDLEASYDSDKIGAINLVGANYTPLAGQTISYSIKYSDRDAITGTTLTTSNGEAEFTIPQWQSFDDPGTITATFQGDATYAQVTSTFAISAPHGKTWDMVLDGPTSVPFGEEATVHVSIPSAVGVSGETVEFSLYSHEARTSKIIGTFELVDGKASVAHEVPFGRYAIVAKHAKPGQTRYTTVSHDVAGIKLKAAFDVQAEIEMSRNGNVALNGHVRSTRAGLIPQGTVTVLRPNSVGNAEVSLDADGGFSLPIAPTYFTATHAVSLVYSGDSAHQGMQGPEVVLLEDSTKDPTTLDITVESTDLSHRKQTAFQGVVTSTQPTSIAGMVTAYSVKNGQKDHAGQVSVHADGRFTIYVAPTYGSSEIVFEYKSDTFGQPQSFTTPVTVSKTPANLIVTGPKDLSLFSETTLDLKTEGVGTMMYYHDFTYTYGGDTESSRDLLLPPDGTIRVAGWNGKLTVPAIRPPLATPKSITFSVADENGFAFAPTTFRFGDGTVAPLQLITPTTATALAPVVLNASLRSGYTATDDVSGTFEFYSTVAGTTTKLGSVDSTDGTATLSTTLPVESHRIGIKFRQGEVVLAEYNSPVSLDVVRNTVAFVGATTHALDGQAPSMYVGRVSSAVPVSFGTVTYAYESVLGKHSGSTAVALDGTFLVPLPTWNLTRGTNLTVSYVKNNAFDASSTVVELVPDNRMVESSVTLTGSKSALEGVPGVFKAAVTTPDNIPVSGGTVHLQRVLSDGTVQHLMSTSVKNGLGSFNYTPTAGTYTLRAEFSGAGLAAANASNTVKFTVTGLTKVSPKISGSVRVGQTIKASATTNIPATTLKYQWYVNGKRISGATGKSYSIPTKWVAKKFTVKATATRAGKTVTTTSKSTVSAARAVTTLKVTPSKASLTRGQTASIKVQVSAPGVSAIQGKIWVRIGDQKVSRSITKTGTYTIKVKTSTLAKGSASVKAAFSATSSSKKYAVSPKTVYSKFTVK